MFGVAPSRRGMVYAVPCCLLYFLAAQVSDLSWRPVCVQGCGHSESAGDGL